MPEMPVQDRAGTNTDPCADVRSSVSKNAEGLTGR
jgi:hypothetical protein